MQRPFFKIVRSGYNRDVLLIHRFAIKFATWRNGWYVFLRGLLCNWQEYRLYRAFRHPQLATVYWMMPGGFIGVYERYEVNTIPLTEDEFEQLPIMNPDRKTDNYSRCENGKIVVLDYGHYDAWYKLAEPYDLDWLESEDAYMYPRTTTPNGGMRPDDPRWLTINL